MKTKGILIPAFGRQGYIYAAYNLLKSIKYHNNLVKVFVLIDDTCTYAIPPEELAEFDGVIKLRDDEVKEYGKINPTKVKLNIYNELPFDETLVLDADNVCLKDIEPLIEYYSKKEGSFFVQNVHSGKKTDGIDYMWAENNIVWDFFELKEDATIYTLQTSSMYIKKNAKTKKLFDEFIKYHNKSFPLEKLKFQWGTCVPDELIISGVLARRNMNCDGGVKVDFLGHKLVEDDLDMITSKHYLLSLYGSGKAGTRLTRDYYKEWADRLMQQIMYSYMRDHKYKTVYIFQDKHANFTK